VARKCDVYRQSKTLSCHLDKGQPLVIFQTNSVEGYINAASPLCYAANKVLDCLLVKGINHREVRFSSGGSDICGQSLKGRGGATGKKHVCALPRKGSRYRTAHCAGRPINHCVLTFK
jgi:hypothetical protein